MYVQVYGSVVANRYSNQHILPLAQMSVSAECYYQPRVNADFDEDSEQMELGLNIMWVGRRAGRENFLTRIGWGQVGEWTLFGPSGIVIALHRYT